MARGTTLIFWAFVKRKSLLSSHWAFLAFFTIILLSAFVTAAELWLGVVLLLIFWFSLVSFVWPMAGFLIVYALAMLMNFNITYETPTRIHSESYPVFMVLLLLLLPAIMGRLLAYRFPFKAIRLDPTNTLLLFLLFWTLASYGWTLDIYHGINIGIKLVFGVGIYFLVLHYVKDRKDLENVFLFTFCWGIVLSLMMVMSNKIDPDGIFQTISIQLAPDWGFKAELIAAVGRPGGFVHANIAGTFTTFIFMLGCALWPLFQLKGKVSLALLAPFLVSNIFSTGSKGAVLAFIIAFLVFLTTYPALRGRRILLTAAFLVSLVCILIFTTIVFQADRLTASSTISELSLSSRLQYWNIGLSLLEERWIGAGMGGFAHLLDPTPGGAHSFYFGILFDTGIVGFCLFLGFLFSLTASLTRVIAVTKNPDNLRYLFCLGSVLIAFSIHFLVDFFYFGLHAWIVFGIIMAAIRIARNDCIECRAQKLNNSE